MRELQAAARANADRLLQSRGVVEAVVQAIGDSLGSPGTGGRNYPRSAPRISTRRRG